MRKAFLLLLLGIVISTTQAQAVLAGVIEITYVGTEIRLSDTIQWKAMRRNASGPIAAGDQIRTNSFGRALLTFGTDTTILLLPDSAFTLEEFVDDGENLQIQARVDGTAVIEVGDNVQVTLESFNLTVTSTEASHWAFWSDRVFTDAVTVARGQVQVISRDKRAYPLGAGQGFRYMPSGSQVANIEAPYNRARLIAALDVTCYGTVRTRSDATLRTGAGTGYSERGFVRETGTYPLLERTRTGYWIRIQYGSAFGWVIADIVDIPCFLPLSDDDTAEAPLRRVFRPTERELELLTPFFGNLDDDPFFYGL